MGAVAASECTTTSSYACSGRVARKALTKPSGRAFGRATSTTVQLEIDAAAARTATKTISSAVSSSATSAETFGRESSDSTTLPLPSGRSATG